MPLATGMGGTANTFILQLMNKILNVIFRIVFRLP